MMNFFDASLDPFSPSSFLGSTTEGSGVSAGAVPWRTDQLSMTPLSYSPLFGAGLSFAPPGLVKELREASDKVMRTTEGEEGHGGALPMSSDDHTRAVAGGFFSSDSSVHNPSSLEPLPPSFADEWSAGLHFRNGSTLASPKSPVMPPQRQTREASYCADGLGNAEAFSFLPSMTTAYDQHRGVESSGHWRPRIFSDERYPRTSGERAPRNSSSRDKLPPLMGELPRQTGGGQEEDRRDPTR